MSNESIAALDQVCRFSKIIAVATQVLESADNAVSWLHRPQPGLGGEIPLDLLITQDGADKVETLLRRIECGVYT